MREGFVKSLDLIQELYIKDLMEKTREVQNRPTTHKVKGNTERNSRISRKLPTQKTRNTISADQRT